MLYKMVLSFESVYDHSSLYVTIQMKATQQVCGAVYYAVNLFQCVDRIFFNLLDEILMLFSYENRKKVPSQFFFPLFKAYKSVKFHFWLGTTLSKMGD